MVRIGRVLPAGVISGRYAILAPRGRQIGRTGMIEELSSLLRTQYVFLDQHPMRIWDRERRSQGETRVDVNASQSRPPLQASQSQHANYSQSYT